MTLKYNINDKPQKVYEWFLYAMQQIMAILVATILIANICGTPISSCFLGAGLGTLIYQVITKFKSPIFISSCGATVSAVIGALAIGGSNNYLAVFIGGLVILTVYSIFALIVKFKGVDSLNKIFPPIIVGAITIVIGLNLAAFIPTYVDMGGALSNWKMFVACFTMLVIAVSSHYFKGFMKTIPFLIGLVSGYLLSLLITLISGGSIALIDFNQLQVSSLFAVPELTFLQFKNCSITWVDILHIIALFAPVAICALLEHYSDHKVLSNIIGIDLTKEPGLHRTLMGDGVASAFGTLICGLPNTTYGESTATTGFSKVASVWVITLASVILVGLSFIAPIQALLSSVPSCVFGGCSMILYGYIASSGLKTIINNKVDLDDNKNLIIVSTILTVGVSNVGFILTQSFTFSGIAFAMILGVILNVLLRNKKSSQIEEN